MLRFPHEMMRLGLLAAVMATVLGCQDQDYIRVNGERLARVAMTDSTPALVTTDEAALFVVEQRVELPVRRPPEGTLRELRQGAEGLDLPFPRLPWVTRGDYEIEVDWLISNLSDEPVRVELIVNGVNEFQEYMPSFVVDDGEVTADFAQYEHLMRLEPLERRAGTVREEAFDEAAVDLATVANGAPNGNLVNHPDNQSALDTRSAPYIPAVIPALTGFRLGLRAESAENVLLEASVRVRDRRKRLGSARDAWNLPTPTLLTPRGAAPTP